MTLITIQQLNLKRQIFHENKFPFKSKISGGLEQQSRDEFSMSKSKEANKIEIEPRKSKRLRIQKDFGPNYYVYSLQSDPTSLEKGFQLIQIFGEKPSMMRWIL